MRRIALALALALGAPGCIYTTYDTGLPGGGTKKTDTATFYLWGLVGEKTLDMSQLCPQGVATWRDYATFSDGALYCLTCGIYGPRSIEVECAATPFPTGPGAPEAPGLPSAPPPPATWLLTPHPESNQTEVRLLARGGRP